MVVLLTFLSALLALIFLGALAYALKNIVRVLNSIGGTPTSYLGKLRFGLRAIERETSHLPPQVGKVNTGLKDIVVGFTAVNEHLSGTVQALKNQER